MRCHDPRLSNVRWAKRETRNEALIAADIASLQGRNIDWDEVADAADRCDWPNGPDGEPLRWIWGPRV
jgi:hypothetical protein